MVWFNLMFVVENVEVGVEFWFLVYCCKSTVLPSRIQLDSITRQTAVYVTKN